jgi:hypothetical protein
MRCAPSRACIALRSMIPRCADCLVTASYSVSHSFERCHLISFVPAKEELHKLVCGRKRGVSLATAADDVVILDCCAATVLTCAVNGGGGCRGGGGQNLGRRSQAGGTSVQGAGKCPAGSGGTRERVALGEARFGWLFSGLAAALLSTLAALPVCRVGSQAETSVPSLAPAGALDAVTSESRLALTAELRAGCSVSPRLPLPHRRHHRTPWCLRRRHHCHRHRRHRRRSQEVERTVVRDYTQLLAQAAAHDADGARLRRELGLMREMAAHAAHR